MTFLLSIKTVAGRSLLWCGVRDGSIAKFAKTESQRALLKKAARTIKIKAPKNLPSFSYVAYEGATVPVPPGTWVGYRAAAGSERAGNLHLATRGSELVASVGDFRDQAAAVLPGWLPGSYVEEVAQMDVFGRSADDLKTCDPKRGVLELFADVVAAALKISLLHDAKYVDLVATADRQQVGMAFHAAERPNLLTVLLSTKSAAGRVSVTYVISAKGNHQRVLMTQLGAFAAGRNARPGRYERLTSTPPPEYEWYTAQHLATEKGLPRPKPRYLQEKAIAVLAEKMTSACLKLTLGKKDARIDKRIDFSTKTAVDFPVDLQGPLVTALLHVVQSVNEAHPGARHLDNVKLAVELGPGTNVTGSQLTLALNVTVKDTANDDKDLCHQAVVWSGMTPRGPYWVGGHLALASPEAAALKAEVPVELADPNFAIFFSDNDDSLNNDAQEKAQRVAAFLKANPKAFLQVDGHARPKEAGGQEDAPAAAQGLSERRAEAVKNFIVTLGINATRITATSFGATQPGDFPAAKQQRVGFTIVSK